PGGGLRPAGPVRARPGGGHLPAGRRVRRHAPHHRRGVRRLPAVQPRPGAAGARPGAGGRTRAADGAGAGPVGAGGRVSGSTAPPGGGDRVAAALAWLRRRLTGEYVVDEFGFDPDLTQRVFRPALRPLYRHWFRTELIGADRLPARGTALVVANHSGTVALDALMLAVGVHDPTGRHRRLRGADFVVRA